MENLSGELLEPELTLEPAGVAHIRKLRGIIVWMVLLSCTITVITLVTAVIRTTYTDLGRYEGKGLLYYELKYSLPAIVSYSVFLIYQLYFVVGFVRTSNKSLDRHDNNLFNHSFSYLYKSNVLAVLSLIIGIVMGTLSLLTSIQLASLAHSNQ